MLGVVCVSRVRLCSSCGRLVVVVFVEVFVLMRKCMFYGDVGLLLCVCLSRIVFYLVFVWLCWFGIDEGMCIDVIMW